MFSCCVACIMFLTCGCYIVYKGKELSACICSVILICSIHEKTFRDRGGSKGKGKAKGKAQAAGGHGTQARARLA